MRVTKQIEIDAAPATVWRCLTEVPLMRRWIGNFEDNRPDPPGASGAGTASTMELREGKRVVAYRSLITQSEPLRRLTMRLTGGSFQPGMEMNIDYALTPLAGDRTSLRWDVEVPLKGVFFRLMAPLFWVMSRANGNKSLSALAKLAPAVETGKGDEA